VEWLKLVLRGLAYSEVVELSNASRIVETHPPDEVLSLPVSSWGANGDFSVWLNPDTEWMWPLIHGAERRMEELVAAEPDAVDPRWVTAQEFETLSGGQFWWPLVAAAMTPER
jgi:1,4-alpha-glucan branching enzyme